MSRTLRKALICLLSGCGLLLAGCVAAPFNSPTLPTSSEPTTYPTASTIGFELNLEDYQYNKRVGVMRIEDGGAMIWWRTEGITTIKNFDFFYQCFADKKSEASFSFKVRTDQSVTVHMECDNAVHFLESVVPIEENNQQTPCNIAGTFTKLKVLILKSHSGISLSDVITSRPFTTKLSDHDVAISNLCGM